MGRSFNEGVFVFEVVELPCSIVVEKQLLAFSNVSEGPEYQCIFFSDPGDFWPHVFLLLRVVHEAGLVPEVPGV